MSDCSSRESRLNRLVDDINQVRGAHYALVVRRHIHKQLVEIDILLIVRADQIVERVTGYR